MRKAKKYSIYGMIGMILLAAFWMLPERNAKAAEPAIYGSKRVVYRDFKSGMQSLYVYIIHLEEDARIVNLKSSNTSIAIARTDGDYPSINLYFLKPGTVEISFQVKQGGSTYDFKESYTVRKMTNPCKSFKVGGREYSAKIWKSKDYTILSTKKKMKVSIKSKKGWKLKNIRLNIWNDTYAYYLKKQIKNGQTINLRGKNAKISAAFEHKETGEVISMVLRLTS